jgi:hypothetical protein
MSLYLPVVAMGSIPHIYQRAGLALGYPYSDCHVSWDNSPRFTIFISVRAELLKCQKPKFLAEVPYANPSVVVVVLPFLLHGSQSHANPRIQFLKLPPTGCEGLRKVVRRSPYNSVQLLDYGFIQVSRASGYLPDFV